MKKLLYRTGIGTLRCEVLAVFLPLGDFKSGRMWFTKNSVRFTSSLACVIPCCLDKIKDFTFNTNVLAVTYDIHQIQ